MAKGNESGRDPRRQVDRASRGLTGTGQSDLPRLSRLIASNLEDKALNETVFVPDYSGAVQSRLHNYRQDRNGSIQDGEPMDDLTSDTAREVNARFKNRRRGGDGSY
jgi:hypothetical protein